MQDMDAVYRQHFRMVYQYLMALCHCQKSISVLSAKAPTARRSDRHRSGTSAYTVCRAGGAFLRRKNGIAAMPAPVPGTLPGSDLSAGIWKSLVPGNRTNYGTE